MRTMTGKAELTEVWISLPGNVPKDVSIEARDAFRQQGLISEILVGPWQFASAEPSAITEAVSQWLGPLVFHLRVAAGQLAYPRCRSHPARTP